MLQQKTLTPDQITRLLNTQTEKYRIKQAPNATGTIMITVSTLLDMTPLHYVSLLGVMPGGELRLLTVLIDLANNALNELLDTDDVYFWHDVITPMTPEELRKWDGE